MKSYLLMMFISVLFVCISCSDKTVNPIPDPEPCEVPKYNQYTMFSGAIRIHNISSDGNYIFYSKLVNDEDYKKLTILNTLTNEKKEIELESLIIGTLQPPYVRILRSTYDNNIVLFEVVFSPENSTINSFSFLKYYIDVNQFEDVTPINKLEINAKNPGAVYKQWLSSSSTKNDFLYIEDKGIYRFQTWEQIKPPDNSVFQYAISNSGNYEIVRKKTDTIITIQGIEITNSNQFKRLFQFSPDEKYFTYIEDIRFDTLNPFTFVQKLHIYDVEKTISSGKAVLHKTIDLPKDLCAFQFTNYVITPKNTIYISMSRFDFKPMKNIYEIDFNGKILRQLTNE